MDEERCWQAVLARETDFDSAFVYAVRSTGIFCRPTCPSRRPGRAQVIFFGAPAAAEQAGFRACRRCRPGGSEHSASQTELAERARTLIEQHPDQALTLDQLGAQIGSSPTHIQRVFKRVIGITPRQYAESLRIDRLKARLKQGDNVTTALYQAGYNSSSPLYTQAPERLGMTPATYGRGGVGAQIGYAIADSPLGRLLVAATERGVCFVSLADSDATLEAALAHEYPAATIRRADARLGEWIDVVVRHLGGDHNIDLPLDVQATAFQWRVWAALKAIPYGDTRSYSQVAAALGDRNAVRAVARACATNPVALVIPCHRVVREGGAMGGYRWGADRKRALLEREQGNSADDKMTG
jgi:AraC family transcriptional regulator, regulatory protein of adaptative response / methylated-DNA-[protein]-cysteine methyltransferase